VNLENFGVQEMSANEMKNSDGAYLLTALSLWCGLVLAAGFSAGQEDR